jgi:glycosyltransferase involved in cell wall biosynthesis
MGLDNLLRALVLVKKQGFHPYTVIGGSGSLKAYLIRMRDYLGLQSDVTLMGFVPANQLSLAYGACDASIIPTSQLECFGIIALEALATGKTTLTTPVGSLTEIMQNFEPKWVASNNTAEGIADLICAYLSGSLPQHSSDELRTVIAQRYTTQRAIEQYEQVLGGK